MEKSTRSNLRSIGGEVMPIESGVGYSRETREKIIAVNEVADWQYGIILNVWSKYFLRTRTPFYYHIDAYCGTGRNPENGQESASLRLLRRLLAEPFQSNAALIDIGHNKETGISNIESMRRALSC